MSDIDNVADGLRPLLSKFSQATHWLRKVGDSPSHAKRPLSTANLAKHLNGGPYVGVGLIAPGESTTMVGVLDFDSHKGETPWAAMQAAAQRVSASLRDRGAQPIAFRSSGGHGIHLYCLWAEPQDAYSVRQWLRAALLLAGFDSGTAGVAQDQVEIFPKQDTVVPGRYGSMVMAPLAGASVPLDPFDLDDLPRDYLIGMDWPMSAPVPVLDKPERELATLPAGDADAAVLESALAAIKNESDTALDYDQWRDVIFAIHHATAGADYGLELAHQFSARSGKYDPDFLDNRVWPYIDSSRPDAVTVRTVLHMARQEGWKEPAELVARDFEVVEVPRAPDGRPELPLPSFKRDDHGNILATIDNLTMAARDPRCCNVVLAYDDFRAEIMATHPCDATAWRQFEDADYTRMQIYMERGGFKKITKETLRDAVWLVAIENRFDSAITWARSLKWDGVPRVAAFLERYCGAKATPYTRAVSRYMWSALAARALEPGAKADMVPVLIGEQGARKSSGVAAMVPWPELFAEMDLGDRDAEASRRMRGRLVIELAELKGLYSRDAEAIKAFITRRHEEWRPLYKEFNTIFPRRNLFIGTANVGEFLSDDTGERRWLPVVIEGLVDVDAIERDRTQLWAEGCAMFLAAGVDWRDAETLARDVHGDHKIGDSWAPVVEQWLTAGDFDAVGGEPGADAGRRLVVQTHEVLIGALGFDAKNIKKGEERRVASLMKQFGYTLGRARIGNSRPRVWVYESANPQDSTNTQDFADLV